MTTDRKNLTLNLGAAEADALEGLARKKELSKTAVLRQALQVLAAVEARREKGEKVVFEGEGGRRYEILIV